MEHHAIVPRYRESNRLQVLQITREWNEQLLCKCGRQIEKSTRKNSESNTSFRKRTAGWRRIESVQPLAEEPILTQARVEIP